MSTGDFRVKSKFILYPTGGANAQNKQYKAKVHNLGRFLCTPGIFVRKKPKRLMTPELYIA